MLTDNLLAPTYTGIKSLISFDYVHILPQPYDGIRSHQLLHAVKDRVNRQDCNLKPIHKNNVQLPQFWQDCELRILI